ncbi:hypothetical protein [Ramlibacter pallidus]|uniref:Uncharacterized protein n=1 Tax=Ramlibacter pallidus TaxID=2780087 RepID=A0ABR9S1C1_9BURK|nr:hypothetical protein [Ramlibacter pallidus]MBE7366889.1 hypothetical protein [Ramlibacter pallidus]
MRLLTAALATLAATAQAHPGHGIAADTHWHASDAWGFVLVGALVLLAIWLSRGD